MIAKLSQLNSCAGRVLTYLASQLPYTYVNLVSLVVHVYLFTLATWWGNVLVRSVFCVFFPSLDVTHCYEYGF